MTLTELIHQLQQLYFKHGDMPVAAEIPPSILHSGYDRGPWHDVTTVVQDTDDGWAGVVLQLTDK